MDPSFKSIKNEDDFFHRRKNPQYLAAIAGKTLSYRPNFTILGKFQTFKSGFI